MHAWPDATTVGQFLARTRRRLLLLRVAEGGTVGSILAAGLVMAGVGVSTFSLLLLATIVVAVILVRALLGDAWQLGWWRSLSGIAIRLERRTSRAQNLIVTASESLESRNYFTEAVMSRAARLTNEIDIAGLFPARATVAAMVAASVALAIGVTRPDDTSQLIEASRQSVGVPTIRRVTVTVQPPAYTGQPPSTATDPSRVEALAGSRVEIIVDATASAVRLETVNGTQELSRADGAFTAAITADADGFLAVEALDSAGVTRTRQLIGLTVTPDRAPRVILASPGRDLFFSTVPGTLPVSISADDDIGLASLRLQFTAVSGSGERFTFTEQDVPLSISQANPRSWAARGTWRLDSLQLAPGDLIVYRAVAADRRPGAAAVESESYVIEVVTPGSVAAEGFAADDQRDRYAASQQMVILKTERLMARRSSLTTDSATVEARSIAAEQRQVRAEFVFMMGGELEDLATETSGTLDVNEVAEAEAEGDLLAGRQQNQGRIDLMRAIRSMSRASTELTDGNLDQALGHERAALDNLMRAFSRSRFILRALTQRERIDLERRLSGSLALTAGLSAPTRETSPDDKVVALRRVLADLASFSSGDSSATGSRASSTAVLLLRSDPGSEELRKLATRVEALARGSASSRRARADSLVRDVTAMLASSLPSAPRAKTALQASLLEGALHDATRGRRP